MKATQDDDHDDGELPDDLSGQLERFARSHPQVMDGDGAARRIRRFRREIEDRWDERRLRDGIDACL